MVVQFNPGTLTATPGALALLAVHYTLPEDLLNRHLAVDWGDLSAEDRQRNDDALLNGSRIFSTYAVAEGAKVWIITEAQDDDGVRRHTTILMPEEY